MSQPGELRAGSTRRQRGQSGQSLIEVIIAILLMGSMFGVVGGAIVASVRGATVNENQQQASAALLTFGEILQTQVDYFECPTPPINPLTGVPYASFSDAYYFQTEPFITGSSSPSTVLWRKPPNVLVEVLSVRSYNPVTESWAGGCASPDSGAQLIRYQVTVCKSAGVSPCAGPFVRRGEVIKRKPGPS